MEDHIRWLVSVLNLLYFVLTNSGLHSFQTETRSRVGYQRTNESLNVDGILIHFF